MDRPVYAQAGRPKHTFSPAIPPVWKWGDALQSASPHLNWRARRESNPHSLGSKPSALSIKLRAHGLIIQRGCGPDGEELPRASFSSCPLSGGQQASEQPCRAAADLHRSTSPQRLRRAAKQTSAVADCLLQRSPNSTPSRVPPASGSIGSRITDRVHLQPAGLARHYTQRPRRDSAGSSALSAVIE